MTSSFLSLFAYWQRHPLARRDLPGTLLRFFSWQLATRILPYPVVYPWIGETSLVIERGMTGATMNVYCGLHEASDMGFLLHFLRPSDSFLDVGANVGTYTILASGVTRAKSIALEPIPHTFSLLSRNIRTNDLLALVDLHCVAVGASPGNLVFTSSRGPMNRVLSPTSSISSGEATVEVSVTTVDGLLSNTAPSLLWKVDVEGYESEVLQGATASLANPELRAVLLEADTPALQLTMHDAGFSRFVYDPFGRKLEPVLSDQQPKSGHNQLWIRDFPFVQERCQSAPLFKVGCLSL
jgi:FkbM family methyltransferase